eukprot:TRINITY_DN1174_c0_g1_i1.p1 TRINITY_DN1174_c0_g1~~TRINITY_DN1174_c0_g1_i1.p1  ORF type:complete len:193 (+),score=78.49 TRINITY_DN1174_c0_g1_i1:216-794(+)
MQETYEKEINIVLLGTENSGKSSLMLKYTDNQFYDSYITTIGIDFRDQKRAFNNILVNFKVYDLAGQERFRYLNVDKLKVANGVLLTHNFINVTTFKEDTQKFLQMLKENEAENTPVLLVLTKSDLQDEKLPITQVEEFCKERNIHYIITSSKDNVNVEKAFETILFLSLQKLDAVKFENKNLVVKDQWEVK